MQALDVIWCLMNVNVEAKLPNRKKNKMKKTWLNINENVRSAQIKVNLLSCISAVEEFNRK